MVSKWVCTGCVARNTVSTDRGSGRRSETGHLARPMSSGSSVSRRLSLRLSLISGTRKPHDFAGCLLPKRSTCATTMDEASFGKLSRVKKFGRLILLPLRKHFCGGLFWELVVIHNARRRARACHPSELDLCNCPSTNVSTSKGKTLGCLLDLFLCPYVCA